jgi:RimJ/RimL family protein N-acetyltransferase
MVDHIERHFSEHGFGLWAIEVPGIFAFIGFAGLEVRCLVLTSAMRGDWLAVGFRALGHGYATEAARLALGYGFETFALPEIVSFTTVANHRSQAVMERLGMRRNAGSGSDVRYLGPAKDGSRTAKRRE